ncbi:MAG TPA: hypothetical protein VHY09_16120 [Candidatus Methylacidiphilales bacterium]|nr:hypothetical protein [Candidatus Methylacidiphilales bacterium]
MKNLLDSFVASIIIGTFVLGYAYIGTVEAQTGPQPPGPAAAVGPPGGNLPVQPHSASTANGPLSSTPSSGVVNRPTNSSAPAATQRNTTTPVNPLTQSPQYGTPNANSSQNATPASGQAPVQGATTNSAGQSVSR